MRTTLKVMVTFAALLAAFGLGQLVGPVGGEVAIAKTSTQPKPRPPLPAYRLGLESTVVVSMKFGNCTGVIVGEYTLLTASHCLDGAGEIVGVTTFANGRFLSYANTARVIVDDGNDHAMIQMNGRLYGRAAKMASMPAPGTPVYVYGHPSGLRYQLRIGYVIGQMQGGRPHNKLFHTLGLDIWHGDSGGAIYDAQGNVVGMVSGYFPDHNPNAPYTWRSVVAEPWAFRGLDIK